TLAGCVTSTCVPPGVEMSARGGVRSDAAGLGVGDAAGDFGPAATDGTTAAVADGRKATAAACRLGTPMGRTAPRPRGARGLGTSPKFPITKYATSDAATIVAAP